MKVKEFIKRLKTFDSEAVIVFHDDGGDTFPADEVDGFIPEQIVIDEENIDFYRFCDVSIGDKIILFAPSF